MTEFEYLQKLSVTKEEYVGSIAAPIGISQSNKAIVVNMGLGHSKSLLVSGGMVEHRKAYITSFIRLTPKLNEKVPLKTTIYCSKTSIDDYPVTFDGGVSSAVKACDLPCEFATSAIDVARIVEDRYSILNFVGQKNIHEYNIYVSDKFGEELTNKESSILRLAKGCVYEESFLMKPMLIVFDEYDNRIRNASEFEKGIIHKCIEYTLKWGAVTGVFLIITTEKESDIGEAFINMFDTRLSIDGDDYFYSYAYKGDNHDAASGTFSRYYDIATEVRVSIPLLQYKEK